MQHLFNRRTFLLIIIIGLIMCGLILLPLPEFFYKIKGTDPINSLIKNKLTNLAAQALKHNDGPIAAIITYNDSIIGEGCNTMHRDSVAYGHAEINALNSAIKNLGLELFSKLDRDKLFLYTTLEPCEMCKGAIVEFRIKHVKFMMDKNMSYWFKENKWRLLYQYHKQQIEGEDIQDSLFNLLPIYNKH